MKLFLVLLVALCDFMVGGQPYGPDTTPFEYFDNTTSLLGHLAVPEGDGPFPAVVIIPDWDGVNEYEQIRATMVAREWGFVGFAADIYGVMPQTVNSTERGPLANFYRSNPDIFGARINAAIEAVQAMENVDADNVALFGYCFGGTGVLQYGLYGNDNVKAIVSFHGTLRFFPEVPEIFGPKVLVLSGGDDNTAQQIMDLEILLDAAEAPWEITRYSGIQHAFTVWSDSRYNEFVDMQSWESAGGFLLEAFGIVPHETALPDAASVVTVDYFGSMDNATLRGYLAVPEDVWEGPYAAVVILPDWTGVNEYEQERATALAELGYVAFAADIFGADKQSGLEIPERIELVTKFSMDPNLYVDRIKDAIQQVKMVDNVDVNEVSLIGYCFGGSVSPGVCKVIVGGKIWNTKQCLPAQQGAILYSFFDGSEAKVAVAFHGSFSQLPPVLVENINPYLLVLSGGDDGLHGNQTIMEGAFESGNADWEITRYAGLGHGYTEPTSMSYSLTGDARSWASMLAAFEDFMPIPRLAMPSAAPLDMPSPAPVATPSPVTSTKTSSPSMTPSASAVDGAMTSAPTEADSAFGANVWKGFMLALCLAIFP